jgi:hypothetical protein
MYGVMGTKESVLIDQYQVNSNNILAKNYDVDEIELGDT